MRTLRPLASISQVFLRLPPSELGGEGARGAFSVSVVPEPRAQGEETELAVEVVVEEVDVLTAKTGLGTDPELIGGGQTQRPLQKLENVRSHQVRAQTLERVARDGNRPSGPLPLEAVERELSGAVAHTERDEPPVLDGEDSRERMNLLVVRGRERDFSLAAQVNRAM